MFKEQRFLLPTLAFFFYVATTTAAAALEGKKQQPHLLLTATWVVRSTVPTRTMSDKLIIEPSVDFKEFLAVVQGVVQGPSIGGRKKGPISIYYVEGENICVGTSFSRYARYYTRTCTI